MSSIIEVTDGGHGGYDPGAIGPAGTEEKNITLPVALKINRNLVALAPQLICHETRTNDEVPWPSNLREDLAYRCKIANDLEATIFVSIHANSTENSEVQGTEVYCYLMGGEGEKLARAIHEELIKVPGIALGTVKSAYDAIVQHAVSSMSLCGSDSQLPMDRYLDLMIDRGVKEANFAVLRDTDMPAALVELAFISNPEEEQLLNIEAFQDAAALAIATGILKYLGITPIPKENAVYMKEVSRLMSGRLYMPFAGLLEATGAGEIDDWDDSSLKVEFTLGGKRYSHCVGSDKLVEV
jgi:N-acetylmuramoyl-L-alanine amidase